MSQLEDLLQQCTVKLTLLDRIGWGTGFFIAPAWILTCAHVVQDVGQPVQVQWQKRDLEAVVERLIPDPYDLALLRVTQPIVTNPPCVYFDAEIRSRDPLYLFGYPDQDFPNGCPVTFSCEGLTGDEPPLIKFALGQVRPGMSGSPLLNQRTGKVCGIVKFTRDRSIDLGGGAIPTRVILEQFPQLQDLQQTFHGGDRLWSSLITKRTEIDFHPYLEVIAKTYEKWWKFYTLTDVEGRQEQSQDASPIFDFGLMAETVKEEEHEQQQQKKQQEIERFPVLEGIRKYAEQHVLLVGRPGSGKSTALARLLLEETTTNPARIPVLVELRYWQGSLSNLIHNSIARHDPALKALPLDTLIANALLLFDGVNELPSEEARSQLATFRSHNLTIPMIFTTRDLGLGGDLGIEKKLEMQPLSEAQMKGFIHAYIPEQADLMLRQLSDRLREFGQTPLLLLMLCEVFQQSPDHQMPSNLAEVFQKFVVTYEASSRRKHEVALLKGDVRPLSDRRLWKPALEALAFAMMQGETPVDFRVVIHRDEAEKEFSRVFPNEKFPVRDVLDDLLKYHLLQNCSTDQIAFRHQLIQEYYAAECLLRVLPTLSDERLKRDYLNYLKWTEPIALALALEKREKQVLRAMRLALDVDLMLAARLAGEVSQQELQRGIINLVIEEARRQQVSSVYEIQLLGNTRSNCVIEDLLARLTDEENQNLIFESAFALREINSRAVIQTLLPVLESSHQPTVVATLFVLGKLGNEEIIPNLRKMLSHSDEDIREQAIEALSELGNYSAVPDLLNALKDESNKVQAKVIEALGNLGNESVLPELTKIVVGHQLILSETFHLRWTAAEALKKINCEKATEELLKALRNEKKYEIRNNIVEGLGRVGSEKAIEGLITALENGFSDWKAAQALVEIGSKKAVPGLIKLLKHSIVCEQAAFALGELGNAQAVPHLINALDHWYPQVQEKVVEALGKIGSKEAISKLYELYETLQGNLNLRDGLLREVVIALGKLGDERIRPELLKIFEDQVFGSTFYRSGWWEIFEALENIGGYSVIQSLIRAMEAKNAQIRLKASEALGNLGDEAAIDSLLIALADEDSTIRRQAANSLGKFDSQQVMPKLSPLLSYKEEPNVRAAAVQVLGYWQEEPSVTKLLNALDDCELSVRYEAAQSLLTLSKSKSESQEIKLEVSKALGSSRKKKLLSDDFLYLVQGIQGNCKFYNYEITYDFISSGKSVTLFFSYATQDEDLQKELAKHLSLLKRQGVITNWDNRQILPGDESTRVISNRLNTADIILLLISSDSVADDTCYDLEIRRAMERHQAGEACVLPILLRPVDWTGALFSQLSMLPKNYQPVTTWQNQDEAFREIAEGIREVAIELRRANQER